MKTVFESTGILKLESSEIDDLIYLYIDGDGMFTIRSSEKLSDNRLGISNEFYYTRAGKFTVSDGELIDEYGGVLQLDPKSESVYKCKIVKIKNPQQVKFKTGVILEGRWTGEEIEQQVKPRIVIGCIEILHKAEHYDLRSESEPAMHNITFSTPKWSPSIFNCFKSRNTGTDLATNITFRP